MKLYDGVSMFYQYGLSDQVANLFVAAIKGSKRIDLFCHTRLPMGFTYAVHLSQGGLTIVCEMAILLMGSNGKLVGYFIWVDNILLAGETRQMLEKFSALFEMVAKYVNMVVRAETDIVTSGQWSGLHIDLTDKCYSLSEKFLEKASDLLRFIKTQSGLPLIVYQKYLGCIAYAAYVLRFPFGYLHSYMRLPVVDGHIPMDGVSHAVVEPLFQKGVKMPLVPTSRLCAGDYILFTDASTEALGAVLIKGDNAPLHLSRRWPLSYANVHINILEARALLTSLAHWPELKDMQLDVYCDNTAVVGAVSKFYSPSVELNAVVVEIHKLCLDKNLYLTIHYVPTLLNLADKPSRPSEYPEYDM